jgi:hypothetical protein
MFPSQTEFPNHLTHHGLRSGIAIFGGLKSRFPDAHIIVFTASSDLEVINFFRNQENTTFIQKGSILPYQFADLVEAIVTDRGSCLLTELQSCLAGAAQWKKYELLVREILEFLFVPPLERVVIYSRRLDGHEIRDLVMPNNAVSFFWDRLRHEFRARHIVIEVKNDKKPITKRHVSQLREYLRPKSIGRFGLMISRLPPSMSALKSRKDAYQTEDCLILFLSDSDLRKMIDMRRRGKDPTALLQSMKEEFELEY